MIVLYHTAFVLIKQMEILDRVVPTPLCYKSREVMFLKFATIVGVEMTEFFANKTSLVSP